MTDPTILPPANPPRAQRGFTLIEVMAALVIFMTGIVGVLAMFTSGLALHRDAERRAVIANSSDGVRAAVEGWLAETILQGKNGAQVDLPKIEGVPVPEYDGYFYSAELSVDPELGPAGGVLARVFVFAKDIGKLRGMEFTLFVPAGARPELEIRKALGLGRADAPAPNETKPDAAPVPPGGK